MRHGGGRVPSRTHTHARATPPLWVSEARLIRASPSAPADAHSSVAPPLKPDRTVASLTTLATQAAGGGQ